MRLKIWNKQDDLYTPAGKMYTAEEQFAEVPLARIQDYVIADQPVNKAVWDNFEMLKDVYSSQVDYSKCTTHQDVLDAICDFREAQEAAAQEAAAQPSTEERTAAALEFLAVNNIPEEEVTV